MHFEDISPGGGRLRQKVEPDPRHPEFILTVHGMGYQFRPSRPE